MSNYQKIKELIEQIQEIAVNTADFLYADEEMERYADPDYADEDYYPSAYGFTLIFNTAFEALELLKEVPNEA